jgi:1,4-dihydroxy-2-naphthoate octaprenyltransferase
MRSILLHLRLPFSILLMPVYFFALAVSPNFTEIGLLWVFVILHLLVYPASNAFNSYFDKDNDSIGLLKNPPKVNLGLYWTANLMDVLALVLAYLKIGLTFSLLVLGYILVSRAYSHPWVRLKKYPWYGWFSAGFFQGFYTFMMAYAGINGFGLENLIRMHLAVPAFLSSVLLWGSFPLTQVYQHREDEQRGDFTISRLLGVLGTFHFAVGMFLIANMGFVVYFNHFHASKYALIFQFFLAPIVLFFALWYLMARRNERHVSYGWAMGMNWIAALSLNAFFIWFWLDRTQLTQVFGSL